MTTKKPARRRIREAVESRGYTVASMEWEPTYHAGEMMGVSGGWMILLDRDYLPNSGNDLGGRTVDELLSWVDYWLEPAEPCECDQTQACSSFKRMPSVPLKGDPKRALHDPECKWHIPYRLGGWPTDESTGGA